MNTVEKGDSFENFVFNYFSSLIQNGYLGFNPNQTRIYKQHKYYSKDRESYIIFDIAIEIFLFGEDQPYMILLIECKNYSKNVPVDDVEEFSTKVTQVGKHNTKAICVTTSGFQKSALKIAKNRKIGLWRILTTKNEHEVVLNRTINRTKENDEFISNSLTSEIITKNDCSNNIYIQTPLRFTTNPKDLIYDFLLSQKVLTPKSFFNQHRINSHSKNIPYKSKRELSNFAAGLLNAHHENYAIDLNKIIEKLGYKLVEINSLNNSNIIGKLETKSKTITIFGVDHYSQHQINFAKAHEIAHISLNHDKHLISENILATGQSHSVSINISQNIDRLEFQANYFAACLLLPENLLKAALKYYLIKYDIKNRGFSPLYIDTQPCNYENYKKIILPLTEIFNVSQETMKIRLSELGLAQFSLKTLPLSKSQSLHQPFSIFTTQ